MSSPRHLISLAIIASFSFVSLAHADGLKDQWITRQPQSANFVKVNKLKAIKHQKEKESAPKEMTKEELIAVGLRRKARLEVRTRRSLEKKTPVQSQSVVPEVAGSTFNDEEKIRSIQKQEKPFSACANLHPRERAECLQKNAFKKTIRMQKTTEAQ